MLVALAAGDFQGIVAWKLDRLLRQNRELEPLLDLLDAGDGFLKIVNEDVDTRTEPGKIIARILVSFGSMESKNISTRVKRAHRELAEQGKHSGGGNNRPFGHSMDRTQVVLEEATIVREAAERVLTGEAAAGICRDFRERGIKTTTGKSFNADTLKQMLKQWRLAGLREYEGQLYAGTMAPILERETVERLRAMLAFKSRRGRMPDSKHLLTGFIFCGNCGHRMYSWKYPVGPDRYICPPHRGCGGVTIKEEWADDYVSGAVVEAIDTKEYGQRQAEDRAVELAEYDQVARKLKDFAEMFALEQITREQFAEWNQPLKDRLAELEALLAVEKPSAVIQAMAGSDWSARDTSGRRAVLKALNVKVTINSVARRGQNTFDPSRFTIEFGV